MSTQPKVNPKYFPHLAAVLILGGGLVVGGESLQEFLTDWEGAGQNIVYADKLAGGLPTVCAGITKHVTKTPVIVGEYWSPAKCAAEEDAALQKVQGKLAMCFKAAPPESVWFAASSFAWNVGVGGVCGSAAMREWNQGDWALGCYRMSVNVKGQPAWSFVGERYVQGLNNRRRAETAKCTPPPGAVVPVVMPAPIPLEPEDLAPTELTENPPEVASGPTDIPSAASSEADRPVPARPTSVWGRLVRWWKEATGSAE